MNTARRKRCRRQRRRRLERRRRRAADAAVAFTLGQMTRAETTDIRAALMWLLEEQRC